MKILVLTAFIAAIVYGHPRVELERQTQWPWQVGKLYRYDVVTQTLTRLEEGQSSGTVFKSRFIIRVLTPGHLQAKLENPQYAQVHQELPENRELPKDLKYEPVEKLDQHFEIAVEGGRVLSLNLPSSLSLAQENMLKGLIGALQVDLSTHRHVHNHEDSYDKQVLQGLFSKMETDVTGDCETLYSVSPVASEWRRELPLFTSVDEPIEITKSKNYGHCHHRVAYHFGVPEGSDWTGTAHKWQKEQFIRRSTVARILAGKQGPMYKVETTSRVNVHPHLYGKQKAEVLSHIWFNLVSFEQDTEAAWPKLEGGRLVHNLLYSMTTKAVIINEDSLSSSSSSESDEHQNVRIEEVQNRVRRSTNVVSINKVISKRNDDDSSSSSSSESMQSFVNDEMPSANEPAYAALYMNPQPYTTKKQNSMNAQRLVQDMAQQLQNPNNMPKGEFLSKFNILVRILASMTYDQLLQTSRSIEIAKTSNNILKMDMWMIYRDAVVQAGTVPAFQQIRNWIQTKKIQEEEAAQVVASLVSCLRYPTKEVMTQFFDLAMSDEVRHQLYLNNTALIAATRFINMGHVDNKTAHNFYPTHMYGRLARKHDPFVLEQILPRLSKDLREAIQREDSTKAQVYIKAIGNLGHRAILEVFTPYLEGEIPVSTFLRREMVNNLQVLAHQRDKRVRAVLYSILRNTAEPFEVRVAAIHNIFMTRPTTSMIMFMAKMTHSDPSIHVRAALKSSIVSIAELKTPRYLDLARKAKAAKWMVTKEEFGKQYSMKTLEDYYDSENELDIMSALSYTGSHDSLFPKFWKYSLKSKSKGWKNANTISASFSSIQELIQFFIEQMRKPHGENAKWETDHKFSAEKISEMLNLKRDTEKPFEANFYVNFMNQQRYFAFSKHDLQELAKDVSQYFSNLGKGIERHYTKVLNQAQVSIMFPLCNGMPFIYKYKEPTVVHIQGKIQGQVQKPSQENKDYSASINKEIYFTYARNLEGSVGFMDTLRHQYLSSGIVNKLQVNIPVKLEMHIKSGEVKVSLEPFHPDQEHTILHYSVWPYTANQKIDTLVPVSLDPTTKLITRENKVVAIDTKFGQSVGTLFHFQGYSYSSDYRNIENMWKSRDLLSIITYALYQEDIATTHYNFKYLGKQSQNKRITFTALYDTFYNLKEKAEQSEVVPDIQHTADSETRRQALVKRVAAGINVATAKIIDLSATFEGPQPHQYVLTCAIANSLVDPKVQYAFYAGRKSEQLGNGDINGFGTVVKSYISTLNFLEALNKEMKTMFEANIKYGQNGNGHIQIQGYTERTKKFAELLQNHLIARMCKEQMAKNNLYQDACHKAIVLAHSPDYIKASVTYKDISPVVRGMIYQAYKMLEYMNFWYTEVNPMKTTADGKLELEAHISHLEKTLNIILNTRLGDVRMKNVPIPRVTPHALAIYTPFRAIERVNNFYTSHQNLPYCTVDYEMVKTFSNRSYSYTLSPSWHLIMQRDGEKRVDDKLVVLARRPTESQQEIYVSYRSRNGMHVEMEVQPVPEGKDQRYNVQVNTNAKKVSEGDLTMYWDEIEQVPLLQYYTGPDGVMMFFIREHRLRAMYDGQRLVILSDVERNNTRGICGHMSGSPRYDYLTPFGLVDKPEHYGACFALKDDKDPKTQELKLEAQKMAYQPKNQYTTILRTDSEWSAVVQSSSSSSSSEEKAGSKNVYRSRSYLKNHDECRLQHQVQYYENHGEICITKTQVPACQSHCRGVDYKIDAVQVICRPKIDQQFVSLRDQIRQGANPQVDGVPQVKQYRVPTSCTA